MPFTVDANSYTTMNIDVSDAKYGIITGFQIDSAPRTSPVIMYFTTIQKIALRLSNSASAQQSGTINIYYI